MLCRSGAVVHGLKQLGQHSAQAVDLIDKVENDADAFVIDAQVVLEVSDQLDARDVGVGKLRLAGRFRWNEPFLMDPSLKRLVLELGAHQEFPLVDHHGCTSRRGS